MIFEFLRSTKVLVSPPDSNRDTRHHFVFAAANAKDKADSGK